VGWFLFSPVRTRDGAREEGLRSIPNRSAGPAESQSRNDENSIGQGFNKPAYDPHRSSDEPEERPKRINKPHHLAGLETAAKDNAMTILSDLLRRLRAYLTTPPPAPCCAAPIRWANFR
jgi:hypothetical protein